MPAFKIISDHQEAAERFLQDVVSNNVRYFDIPSFTSDAIPSVYPVSYLAKCTSVTVAISGSATEGVDWMVVCPNRVDLDRGRGGLVHDIDPLILTLDSQQQPSPIGVIGYHLNFPGRTTPIAGYALSDYATSVTLIRSSIITGLDPLAQIPRSVDEALQHMANYFRTNSFT